jgi:hypothetical protein
MFQAGTSVTVVSPPLGHPIAGLFHRREATTIRDDLVARTLVLADGAIQVAIVVCDLISLKASFVHKVRMLVHDSCGIPPQNVFVSCTHTHSGPVTSPSRGEFPDPDYLEWLAVRIADGIRVAQTRLEPARIAHGVAQVDGVCFNRRYRMRDGTVVFNPGPHNPDVVEPTGPIDPEVVALLVESVDGAPLALWSCLSTHYAGTDDELAISADYYGDYARAVSRCLGEQCVGLHANGTSGNINTIDPSEALGVSGNAKARLVGLAVAAAAIQAVMTQARQSEGVALETISVPFIAKRWPVTLDDIQMARDLLAQPDRTEPLAAGSWSYLKGQPIPAYQIAPYAQGLLEIAEMPETRETEIQLVRIGDFLIVGLPGEIFVEFGLAIKASSSFRSTAVVGLANDILGYIPTESAFDEGGYETWRSAGSWTARGTGETMTQLVCECLKTMEPREVDLTARLNEMSGVGT